MACLESKETMISFVFQYQKEYALQYSPRGRSIYRSIDHKAEKGIRHFCDLAVKTKLCDMVFVNSYSMIQKGSKPVHQWIQGKTSTYIIIVNDNISFVFLVIILLSSILLVNLKKTYSLPQSTDAVLINSIKSNELNLATIFDNINFLLIKLSFQRVNDRVGK